MKLGGGYFKSVFIRGWVRLEGSRPGIVKCWWAFGVGLMGLRACGELWIRWYHGMI